MIDPDSTLEEHLKKRRRTQYVPRNHGLRFTVKRVKQILDTLPDDLELEFSPISGAWLGTMTALRAKNIDFFDGRTGNHALPSAPGAYGVIYLHEEYEVADDDE